MGDHQSLVWERALKNERGCCPVFEPVPLLVVSGYCVAIREW